MKTVDVTPPAAGNDMSAATPHVLVVEDEQKTRDSVAEGLRLEDWRVTTAVSGDEAVQVLERATFDLLILDWMLPGLNGLALLQQIRARGNHAPALLLTARRSLDERVTP